MRGTLLFGYFRPRRKKRGVVKSGAAVLFRTRSIQAGCIDDGNADLGIMDHRWNGRRSFCCSLVVMPPGFMGVLSCRPTLLAGSEEEGSGEEEEEEEESPSILVPYIPQSRSLGVHNRVGEQHFTTLYKIDTRCCDVTTMPNKLTSVHTSNSHRGAYRETRSGVLQWGFLCLVAVRERREILGREALNPIIAKSPFTALPRSSCLRV